MGKRGAQPGYIEWEKPGKIMLLRGWAMEGLTNDQIADKIGVVTSTFHEWRKASTKISDAIKMGKEEADKAVEQALYRKALEGEGWAVCFWLKNRDSVKWRDKQDLTVRTEPVVIYDGVPDEEE